MAKEPLRILVVEDQYEVRTFLTMLLRDHDYAVEEACDGREALKLLEGTRIDLILLDFMMPVMNGSEFASKSRELYPRMPIILMTGENNPEERASQLGAVAFLRKPFDLDALLDTVALWAEHPQSS